MGPGAHPTSCTIFSGSFPGVKLPGHGVDHLPPSSTEVKERLEPYVYFPFGPSYPILGRSLHFMLFYLLELKGYKSLENLPVLFRVISLMMTDK